MTQTVKIETGSKVYVASEARYLGRFTIESVDHAGSTVTVTDGRRTGKAAFDQLFQTAKAAKANIWQGEVSYLIGAGQAVTR